MALLLEIPSFVQSTVYNNRNVTVTSLYYYRTGTIPVYEFKALFTNKADVNIVNLSLYTCSKCTWHTRHFLAQSLA